MKEIAKDMMLIKDMACSQLEEIRKGGKLNLRDANDQNTVAKLTEIVKNIMKIEALEKGEYQPGGYSHDGEWMANGTYGHWPRMGHSYDDGGASYANRGKHYARGHYSRDDGMDYSRDDSEMGNRSYSRNGDPVEELRQIVNKTSGKKRDAIRMVLKMIEDD